MARGSDMFPSTHRSLLERLKHDDQAWAEFYRLYGRVILRLALRARLPDADAQDVQANVLRRFHSAVRRGFAVDPSRGRFRAFLRTLTRREIMRQQRWRRQAWGAAAHPDDVPRSAAEPENQWATLERQARWVVVMQRLRAAPRVSHRDLRAFEDYELNEQPAPVVAKRYGVTVNRLYGIRHEMLRRLRVIKARLDRELGEV